MVLGIGDAKPGHHLVDRYDAGRHTAHLWCLAPHPRIEKAATAAADGRGCPDPGTDLRVVDRDRIWTTGLGHPQTLDFAPDHPDPVVFWGNDAPDAGKYDGSATRKLYTHCQGQRIARYASA